MSNYVTAIGLDVHARSISACAFDPMTGEVSRARFGYDPASVAEWALGFESPKAVYESGPTGFHLCRALRALGVDRAVGARSKMHRPTAGARTTGATPSGSPGSSPAATSSRCGVPDERTEAARDAPPEDAHDLQRARQRMSKFLLRHGLVFDETRRRPGAAGRTGPRRTGGGRGRSSSTRPTTRPPTSTTRTRWTAAARPRGSSSAVVEAACAPRVGADGRRAVPGEGRRRRHPRSCSPPRRATSRGSERAVVRRVVGLAPSERSSGETESRGGITRAGNSHVRRALVEASWHVPMSTRRPKKPRPGHGVAPAASRHAAKCNRRLRDRRDAMSQAGKRPCVANCATAREMACWVWAIALMVR